MNWREYYSEHLMTADEAVRLIHSGDRVVVSQGASLPDEILEAMARSCSEWKNTEIFHIMSLSGAPHCDPAVAGKLRFNSMFCSGPTRVAVNEGRADYTPAHFSDVPKLMYTTLKPRVAVVQLSVPDENGICSMGPSCDYMPAALANAEIVIGLINKQQRPTFGETDVPVTSLHAIVETDRVLPLLPSPKIGPVETAIGSYCASLIPDGACLQLGIGAIPDAVLMFLKDKKDLGIHSEMISDGVMKLMQEGVVNNSRKNIDKGVTVVTFLMGSTDLYDFCAGNPAVKMMPVDYTNDPKVVGQIDDMICINSCLQVDLSGQVNSESIGEKQFSGSGGQFDFVRGAALSNGGKAIMAMPSTAAKGKISRIVANLDLGAAVTTLRNDVDYIVTEYGIAHLKGHSLRQRARALINIAHPDFRADLIKVYEERFGESFEA